MHPDQFTPDQHRTQEPDSVSENQAPPTAAAPEQEQRDAAFSDEKAGTTEVRTPDADGGRKAEAGNAYMGRQMDDDLKATSRIGDAAPGGASSRVHPDEPAEGARDAG